MKSQADKAKDYPGAIGSSWQGATATAVKGEMAGLGVILDRGQGLIDKAADAVGAFQGAVADLVEDVATLNRHWQESHNDYLRQKESDLGGAYASEEARAAAQERKVFNADTWWAHDSANFERRFTALKEDFKDKARAFVRDLAECQLVTLPGQLAETARCAPNGVTAVGLPFVAQQLSPQLKLAARHEGENWDLFENPADAQEEAVRIADLRNDGLELSQADQELLDQAAKNPQFAHAYALARGPRNMALAASTAAMSIHSLQRRIPPLPKEDLAAFQAGQELTIKAEARILATASGQLGPEYAQKMIDLGKKDQAAAYGLSVAMHLGGDFERKFEDVLTKGISPGDSERNGYPDSDAAPFSAPWVPLFGKPDWVDPMTGLLAMKARDPAESQRFLQSRDGGSGSKNRLEQVHQEQARRPEVSGGTPTDSGRAAVVESASTTLRDHDGEGSPGWKSAQIAGQTLTAYSGGEPNAADGTPNDKNPNENNPNDKNDGRPGGEDTPRKGPLPPAMRETVAKIVSAYLVDFVSAQDDSGQPHGDVRTDTPPGSIPGQSYGVHIDRREMRHLIAEVVKDPRAVEHLLNSELVLADASLKHAASLLRDGTEGIGPAEAKELYFTILRQHGGYLRLLESA
ncbi:MAG: hypothetical protein ACRC0L_06145, partial [Angustibacter sp.]